MTTNASEQSANEESKQSVQTWSVEKEWQALKDEWIEIWKEDCSFWAREIGAIKWDGSWDASVPQTPFEREYLDNNFLQHDMWEEPWVPTLEEYIAVCCADDDTIVSNDQSSQVNDDKDEESKQSVQTWSVEKEWQELQDEWVNEWKEDIYYLGRKIGMINWDGSMSASVPQTPFEVKWDGYPDYVLDADGTWAPTLDEYKQLYKWIDAGKEFEKFDPYNDDDDDDDNNDNDNNDNDIINSIIDALQVNNNKDDKDDKDVNENK